MDNPQIIHLCRSLNYRIHDIIQYVNSNQISDEKEQLILAGLDELFLLIFDLRNKYILSD